MNDISQALLKAATIIGTFDSELMGIVALSLRVSLSAAIIAMAIGTPLAGLLAVLRFRGQQGIVVFANALLGLPPVVVGLFVYLMLSRSGPLGFANLLFTPTAMVIAVSLDFWGRPDGWTVSYRYIPSSATAVPAVPNGPVQK